MIQVKGGAGGRGEGVLYERHPQISELKLKRELLFWMNQIIQGLMTQISRQKSATVKSLPFEERTL